MKKGFESQIFTSFPTTPFSCDQSRTKNNYHPQIKKQQQQKKQATMTTRQDEDSSSRSRSSHHHPPTMMMKNEYLLTDLKLPCVYHDPTFLTDEEATMYYEQLHATIPWHKTSKINRWVRLYTAATATTEDDAVEDNDEAEDGQGTILESKPRPKPQQSKQQQQQQYAYKDAPLEDTEPEEGENSSEAVGYPELVETIRQKCQAWYRHSMMKNTATTEEEELDVPSLNVCLLNFYENGSQRIGWHSDREEIGRTTPIVSVSLGSTRQFLLRSQTDGRHDRCTLALPNGSLTLMTPQCQTQYLHSIAKEAAVTEGRINLTFRCKEFTTSTPTPTSTTSKDKNKDSKNNPTTTTTTDTTEGEELHERRDTFIDRLTEGITPTAAAWTNNYNTDTSAITDGTRQNKATSIFGEETNLLIAHNQNQQTTGLPKTGDPVATVQFVIKTNMGAERYCEAEIREVLAGHGLLWQCQQQDSPSELPQQNKSYTYDVAARPFDIDGYIAVVKMHPYEEKEDEEEAQMMTEMVRDLLLELKTAHHVLIYHHHFVLQDCLKYVPMYTDDTTKEISNAMKVPKETLYEYVKEELLRGNISFLPASASVSSSEIATTATTTLPQTTFRVSCDRVGGPHRFQGPEVEYEIGGALAEVYGDRSVHPTTYQNWQPQMTNYDVHVRADVHGTKVILGTQCNIHDLSKGRHFARFRNSVTIKTNLAYAMVRLANIGDSTTMTGDGYCRILDPFCGSGTLLLEALDVYGPQKLRGCLGMDVSRRSANGARENATAEGYNAKILKFVCCDARSLRRHVKSVQPKAENGNINKKDNEEEEEEEAVMDAIITNLPWGIMTGQNQSVDSLQTMYEIFLRNAWYILKPGGRIVMLVLRGLQLMRIVRKLSGRYNLLHINIVRTTNNLPSIIVIEKVQHDEIRESVKGQLAHLNQYVTVSPEIYHTIHNEAINDD